MFVFIRANAAHFFQLVLNHAIVSCVISIVIVRYDVISDVTRVFSHSDVTRVLAVTSLYRLITITDNYVIYDVTLIQNKILKCHIFILYVAISQISPWMVWIG